MFIDIGASSREEALEWGVLPGDMIVPHFEFTVMNNEKFLLAKAWDNRIGCAIAIDVLRNLQNTDHPNIVYGVGTVQEEVGLRGAKTAAHTIQPDIAFGVDVGIAGDTPGISEKEAQSKMGKGRRLSFTMHPWSLTKVCVMQLWQLQRKPAFPTNLMPLPAAELIRVPSI